MSLALAGCAVSGGPQKSQTAGAPVSSAQLPPLVSAQPVETASSPDKFLQSNEETLAMQTSDVGSADAEAGSETKISYANTPAAGQAAITTSRADLKPFVGRWVLVKPAARSKMEQVGSYLGLADRCEVVLEEAGADLAHKAKGSSSCPTSLFMLDAWTAFDDRLVLKDHMGDEIVSLKSRGTGTWVGVSRDGQTLVLEKS